MARNTMGIVINSFVRAAKTAERASRQAARQREREQRAYEREMAQLAKKERAADRFHQKQLIADQRDREQSFFEEGKDAFAARCQERAALRESLLKTIFP